MILQVIAGGGCSIELGRNRERDPTRLGTTMSLRIPIDAGLIA
jgi:hypothetical protein